MKISVVIPLYNKRDTVERALESVLAQTVQPFEIIVVNDGSTDGSEQIVEEINHPLVRLVHQPNAGVSSARNNGIYAAKGDWIAFLDADDVWLPEFLESIVELHQRFPECNVLGTAYYNSYQNNIDRIITLKYILNEKYQILDYFKIAAYSSPPICSSAVVVKKSSLQMIYGFPVELIAGEDLITWVKLAKNNKIGYCTKGLARYFIAIDPTIQSKRQNLLIENNIKVTEVLKDNLDLSNIFERYYFAEWYKIISMQYLTINLRKEAFRNIIRSIGLRPFKMKIYLYFLLLVIPPKYISLIKSKF